MRFLAQTQLDCIVFISFLRSDPSGHFVSIFDGSSAVGGCVTEARKCFIERCNVLFPGELHLRKGAIRSNLLGS